MPEYMLEIGLSISAIIIGILLWNVFVSKLMTEADQNETATGILRNLIIRADEANIRTAILHLQELERVFNRVLTEYPDHELTKRIRWIITENMVQLCTEYLQSDQRARVVLGPYSQQLDEIRRHLMSRELEAAATAADKSFNWEHRDCFTI